MTFRPNPRFDEEMQRQTAPYVQRRTRNAADRARASAPRRTGAYDRSIRVDNEAIGATLYTDDWAGHIIEWGSARQRAFRVLSNAAIAEADRVDLE